MSTLVPHPTKPRRNRHSLGAAASIEFSGVVTEKPERAHDREQTDRTDRTDPIEREERRSKDDMGISHSGRSSLLDISNKTMKTMKNIMAQKHTASYDKLIHDDDIRQQTASYTDDPFYRIIFRFRGTVWTVIFWDVLFWISLAVYIGVRVNIHFDDYGLMMNLDVMSNLSSSLVYIGGFLLFFLVFYVNQNNSRYFDLHKESMAAMERLIDVSTMMKACVPMERARRVVRYMNAAHVCAYTGLSEHYEKENFFDPLNKRFSLLTNDEEDRIVNEIDVDDGKKAALELISWVIMDIQAAQEAKVLGGNEAFELRVMILTFQRHVLRIFMTCTLPIPFFYVHFLSILTAVYLPLFAITIAMETGPKDIGIGQEIISGLVVFLQALFTIGLRILGQQLSDPYGDDMIDLQIARYVINISTGSNQILQAKRPPRPSRRTELSLKRKMAPIGDAYEYDSDEEIIDQF